MKDSFLDDIKRDLEFFRRKFYLPSGGSVSVFTCLLYLNVPSYALIFWYRVYSRLYNSDYKIVRFLGRFLYYRTSIKYASEIHPNARIGVPFRVGHHFGIVIGEKVVIGSGVYVFNDVTLGNKNVGQIKDEMPTIGDDVIIGVGSKVLGGVLVESGSIIGANSTLINNVGTCEVWAGYPARFIKKNTHYDV